MMDLKMKNKMIVVYICHDVFTGGAALSLINMIKSVSPYVTPIVLLKEESEISSFFNILGIRILRHNFTLDIANSNKLFRISTTFFRRIRDYYINSVCIKKVANELDGLAVDVVHSNSSVISFGGDLAKKLKAKHVWHIREFMDMDFNMRPVRGFKALERKIYKADAQIAITNAIYNKWKLYNASNSYVIHNAVRSVSEVTYVPEKEKYILFCSASLSDNKGADKAAEIFCKSKIYDKGYKLYYIGNYSDGYRKKIEQLFSSYGQRDALVLLGFQSNIKKYMTKAAAFIMCSRFEGLGRVTIEAMFYGCPVLGHNAGGTVEVINHNKTGLLYSNVDEGSYLLGKLITDNNLSNRLAKAAINDAMIRFSEEEYGKKIMNVYRSVLK